MDQERLYHRAGGRRKYNSMRRLQAALRREALLRYLRRGGLCTGQWGCSRQAAPVLQAVGLTPSSTVRGDTLLDEEPADDAAYERQLLGHLLDSTTTMLP